MYIAETTDISALYRIKAQLEAVIRCYPYFFSTEEKKARKNYRRLQRMKKDICSRIACIEEE